MELGLGTGWALLANPRLSFLVAFQYSQSVPLSENGFPHHDHHQKQKLLVAGLHLDATVVCLPQLPLQFAVVWLARKTAVEIVVGSMAVASCAAAVAVAEVRRIPQMMQEGRSFGSSQCVAQPQAAGAPLQTGKLQEQVRLRSLNCPRVKSLC